MRQEFRKSCAAGPSRAEVTVEQVLRELAKIGFSDIRKAVAWRNEMVAREDEEVRKGEEGAHHHLSS